MNSGRHTRLPKTEVKSFEDGLRLQARADGVSVEIDTTDNGDDTVDMTWTVSTSATNSPVSSTIADVGRRAAAAVAAVANSPASTAAVSIGVGVAAGAATAFVLGRLSERFEVGSRGPGAVSSGAGDHGGVSYGCYQMTSRPNGGTVSRFVRDQSFPFVDRFAGLTPGTPAFSDAWRTLAAERPEEFRTAQHDFIRRTHFDPLIRRLRESTGLEVLARSPALQDCLWSTAVQHGPDTDIPLRICKDIQTVGAPKPDDAERYDEEFIRRIYAERGRRNAEGKLAHFPSSSADVQAGVAQRFDQELQSALRMLSGRAI